MQVWLEMACPECDEAVPLTEHHYRKLEAKYPVPCSQGHKYKRADGFIHWLVQLGPFGHALLFCNTVLEGEIVYDGEEEYVVKLPFALHSARVWPRHTEAWKELKGDVDFAHVYERRWLYITLRVPRRRPETGTSAVTYQVVGARGPSRLPGWRQVMGEALAAYEEGRANASVLLSNIAFETFYSAIADRRLRRKGMPQDIINELHQRIPLEVRLREGFARSLRLPALSSAPFWKDWQRKARKPRHGLAHQWLFDRKRGKRHASAREAYDSLVLHLASIYYLDAKAFDYLGRLRTNKATSPGEAT